MEEGENGPVTPDSPELHTQDTRVNGSSVQLKDGKAAGATQNSVNHSGSLRRVSIHTDTYTHKHTHTHDVT